jgi:hypothetical protein
MSKPPTDPGRGDLAATFAEITLWLDQNGIRRFWGAISTVDGDSRLPLATWNTEINSDWKDFLSLGKDLGAGIVFIDRTVLRLDEYLDDVDLPGSDEVQSLLRLLRPHDGEIRDLELQWTIGSIVMRFICLAAWNSDLERLDRLSSDEDQDEDEETGESAIDEEEVERHALTLANDPSFQAAKTNAQRRYAAKKLLAERSIGRHEDTLRILDEAKSIFELEIRPKQQVELVRRVEELKESGATRAQIAKQLGLTSERVKNLGG